MAAAHCLPVQSEMVRVTAWAVALTGKDCRYEKVSRRCRVPRQQEDAEAKLPWHRCVPADAPLMSRLLLRCARPYDVDASFMQLLRHERGIHAV